MKNVRIISIISFLLILPLFLGNQECKPSDDLVTVTYQHLANFQAWNLNGKSGGDQNGMWHVYMLRGITNTGKNAKSFAFDIQKLTLKSGGGNVNSSSSAMLAAEPQAMPLNFKATINAPQIYTVPFGTGALFFIKQENDTEKTAVTKLVYKSGSGERVLPVMLDSNATAMYGQLDQAFLNKIHARQNEYENSYDAGGNKK